MIYKNFTEEALQTTINALKSDKLIILPTDTGYLLGANGFSEKAIMQVFQLKQRPLNKPIHLIIADIKQAKQLIYLGEIGEQLATIFWPGPLTIIGKCYDTIPSILNNNGDTLGLRVPEYPPLRQLVMRSKIPITATSANLSGQTCPFDFNEVKDRLGKNLEKIDIIWDFGIVPYTQVSTIVEIEDNMLKLLRKGALSWEQIKQKLTELDVKIYYKE